MSANGGDDVEIAVSFVTRLPEAFRVSESPITVPGKLTRYGLSEVVNHLLGTETPTPFDFLVDGVLLRTSLAKLALKVRASAEATLVVEYVPALGPPTAAETAPHDDWVSSVDGSWATAVVSGGYDNKARLWSPKGKLLAELDGHNAQVCAVSLAPPSDGSAGSESAVVLTASADGTARSYAVTVKGKKCDVGDIRVFKGHTGTVTDIAAAFGVAVFATASVDGSARVWKLDGGEFAEEKKVKKRKKSKEVDDDDDDDDMNVDEPQIGLGEELVLSGHTDQVRAVSWASSEVLWTGSFDHTIRSWNIETGEEIESHSTHHGVHCLSVTAGGNKIAFGGVDAVVNVWDAREGATAKGCLKLKSHEVRRRPQRVCSRKYLKQVKDVNLIDSRHSCVRAKSNTLIFY